MGSNINDKWLGKLRDSVENHSEPLPDGFWEELKRDIPATVPVRPKRRISEKLIFAMAAAAVLLLGIMVIMPADEDVAKDAMAVAVQYGQVQEQAVGHNDDEVAPLERESGKQQEYKLRESYGKKKPDVDDVVAEKSFHAAGAPAAVEVADGNVHGHIAQQKKVPVQTGNAPNGNVQDVENQTTAVHNDAKDMEREEYLKELEYLREERLQNRKQRGKMVSLSLGNGGFGGGDNDFSSKLPLNSTIDAAGNPAPEEFASFINMAGQSVENITWMGGKAPSPFKNPVTYKSYTYDHNEPLKLGISFAVELGRGFYAESGISYQYLKSSFQGTGSENVTQKLHYIGLPLRVGVNFMRERRFQIYLSGGYLLEKCVYGVLERANAEDLELDIKGLLNSFNVTAGVQVKTGNFTSLYLEPGYYRYVGLGKEIGREHGYILKNIYSEEPSGFLLQGGLRFMF